MRDVAETHLLQMYSLTGRKTLSSSQCKLLPQSLPTPKNSGPFPTLIHSPQGFQKISSLGPLLNFARIVPIGEQ